MLVRVKAGLVQRPVACDLAVPLLSHLTRNGKHLSGFATAKRRPIWRGPTMWESPLSIGCRQPALSQMASRQANKAQAIAPIHMRSARGNPLLRPKNVIKTYHAILRAKPVVFVPQWQLLESIIAIERQALARKIPEISLELF